MSEPKEESDYSESLKKLKCPFTWDMDDILKDDDCEKKYHENDDEELLPFLKLIRQIMSVYVLTNTNADKHKDEILAALDDCESILRDLEKNSNPEISAKVVEYVWKASKCFVYDKLEMTDELKKLLDEVKDVEFDDKKEKSTLTACRAAGWSKYHRSGSYEAAKYIIEAIEDNPKCDLWYFIMAKNLRRQRRDSSIAAKPSAEETKNFLKAMELSDNVVYKLFVAQMYRESKNEDPAKKIYRQIFDGNPEKSTILLRLALGFIRLRDYQRAKVCLDKAAEKNKDCSMYSHYHGIYYMKQKLWKEALPYYKKAIEEKNLPAEKDYLHCLIRSRSSVDITNYLSKMLDKYKNFPESQVQDIILDLGFCYWKKHNDLKKSVDYILRAIEINPKSSCLTNYFDWINIVSRERQVFVLLKTKFLPVVNSRKSQFDEASLQKIDKLNKICSEHYSNQLVDVANILDSFSF